MLKKSVAPLLVCAALLLAAAPSKAFAQTLARPAPTGVGQSSGDARAKPQADLRGTFAGVTARSRAGTVTGADIKRLERGWLDSQTTAQAQSGFTKKQKVLVIALVVVIVGLAVVLAHNTEKGGHTFCDIDPSDPDCIGTR